MKNYYDKVLFLLGLILLGLGVGYVFMKGGLPAGTAPRINPVLTGGAYEAVPVSNVTAESATWDPAPDQYDGTDTTKAGIWVYSVFTPPKIWWDTTSGWTAEPPKPPKPPKPPFGLHFDNIAYRLYRIQFHGYLGSVDKPILQLEDTSTKTFFNAKLNEDQPNAGIKVTGFKVVLVTGADGGIIHVGTLTMIDDRTHETVTLTENKPLILPNDRYFLLETDSPLPSQNWEVTKVGETLDVGDVNFKIVGLDYNAPSVTVDRTQPNQEDQSETLTPTAAAADVTPSATPSADAASAATPPATGSN